MAVIKSFEVLDEYLDRIEAMANDDKMRAEWAEMTVDPALWSDFPRRLSALDPFSQEYEVAVKEFLRHMQGRDYSLDNEGLDIDVDFMCAVGYPYTTRSAQTVGNFLIAYGFIIKTMNLPVPSRILDVGSGAGSLTIHLAKMGYEMTCVDANAQFVELLRRMTGSLPNPVECICADMAALEFDKDFDVILFMESFHHSLNHRETLRRLRRYLKEDGAFVFAAEPVLEHRSETVPYPWGPRLDGESVRSIRKHGWIELGFEESYFNRMLLGLGFAAKRMRSAESWWADVIVARRLLRLRSRERLEFSSGARGVNALGVGWSQPESFGTWSCEDRAVVRFGVESDPVGRGVKVGFRFLAFLTGQRRRQVIAVWVNGSEVESWVIKGSRPAWTERWIAISLESLEADGGVEIEFRFSSPTSPKENGINEDTRRLAMALQSIELRSG